jgi:VCBS repeat-containing protein
LSISDADSGQAGFVEQPVVSGGYGTFSIDANGNWTYVLDNDASQVQRLTSSESIVERFTVQALDGTSSIVEVTVRGLDDAPPVQQTPSAPLPPSPPAVNEAAPDTSSSPVPVTPVAVNGGSTPLDAALSDSRQQVTAGGPLSSEMDPMRSAVFSDVYTSSSGFRVVVMEAPEPTLTLYRGMGDQYADAGAVSSFAIPYDAFVHTDPQARVVLSAMQANGEQLPEWLTFNPMTGKFEVVAPQGFRGEVAIKVTARDSQGREVSTLFRISIGEKHSASTVNGRPGLSEQLRMAAKRPTFAFAELPAGKVAAKARVL